MMAASNEEREERRRRREGVKDEEDWLVGVAAVTASARRGIGKLKINDYDNVMNVANLKKIEAWAGGKDDSVPGLEEENGLTANDENL